LNGLIEKECQLLQQGLSHIELVKQWYVSQLHENTMKKTNTKKLKYQNLFGIDKMLTELKQTNEMNLMFVDFLAKNKLENNVVSAEMNTFEPIEPASSNEKETIEEQQKLPSYDDYVEKFDLNKQDAELENYLREKQMRIENLQKEKSSLIRRLFEMKSESANLACTILKLEENTLNNKSSSEQTKLKPLDNNIKIVDSNVQDLNQINKFTNQPKANLIVNFNSLYPNSYENELKLNSNENENFAVKSNKPQFFQTINNNNQRQKSYF
jgi:predicted nuclease with TOPRIM domain